MNYPASDGIGLCLFAYGTGLKVEQGFSTPCLHTPFKRQWENQDDEFDDNNPSSPEVIQVYIRGTQVEIQTKDVVRLGKSVEFDFDLLNHLIDIYGEELYSTDKELYLYVSKDLKKLVQFDSWYHEDDWHQGTGAGVWEGDKFHIPRYTCGVKVIAQILETRNFNLYKSQSVDDLGFDWEVFE